MAKSYEKSTYQPTPSRWFFDVADTARLVSDSHRSRFNLRFLYLFIYFKTATQHFVCEMMSQSFRSDFR